MAGREGASGIGVRVGRVCAVTACRDRGFAPGAVLRSAEWAVAQRVVEVGTKFVTIRLLAGGRTRVRTFPADVFIVDATV